MASGADNLSHRVHESALSHLGSNLGGGNARMSIGLRKISLLPPPSPFDGDLEDTLPRTRTSVDESSDDEQIHGNYTNTSQPPSPDRSPLASSASNQQSSNFLRQEEEDTRGQQKDQENRISFRPEIVPRVSVAGEAEARGPDGSGEGRGQGEAGDRRDDRTRAEISENGSSQNHEVQGDYIRTRTHIEPQVWTYNRVKGNARQAELNARKAMTAYTAFHLARLLMSEVEKIKNEDENKRSSLALDFLTLFEKEVEDVKGVHLVQVFTVSDIRCAHRVNSSKIPDPIVFDSPNVNSPALAAAIGQPETLRNKQFFPSFQTPAAYAHNLHRIRESEEAEKEKSDEVATQVPHGESEFKQKPKKRRK